MDKIKVNGFTLVKWALHGATDLTTTQKLVLIAVCDFADEHGVCYPSQTDTLEQITGLKRQAICRAVDAIREKGYWETEWHGRGLIYKVDVRKIQQLYLKDTADVSERYSMMYPKDTADVLEGDTNIPIENNILTKQAIDEEEKKNPAPSASSSAASVDVSTTPKASKPLPPFSTASFEDFRAWAIRDDVWAALGPVIAPKLPEGLDREGQRNAIGGIMRKLHALITTKTINGSNPIKFVAAVLRGEIDRFLTEPQAESVTASSMPFGSIAEKLAALIPVYSAEYPESEHIDSILAEGNVPEYLIGKLRGCKTIGLARAIMSEYVASEVALWLDAEVRNRREDNMRNVEQAIEAGKIKPGADGTFSWQQMQQAMLGVAS